MTTVKCLCKECIHNECSFCTKRTITIKYGECCDYEPALK